MRFLSVCSGIEAASVAWNPLGWQAVAFSEIEKFPSAVLAHHYPDVPNLGDFTKIDTATLGPVDILSGGTPCQAFSVAGLRQSLDDARGNLSLSFVRLAHELAAGNGLRNVVWENVPGVLSTKDNAFGCFLGALVGADDALPSPAGKRWPDAGMVDGPKGRAAWRILDAQFFALAQRRRRVIVVADFGNGADPAAVLFERASLSGNTPPSREAGENVARGTAYGISPDCFDRTGEGANGTAGERSGLGIEVEVAYALRAKRADGVAYAPEIARCDDRWPAELASTLNAAFGSKLGLDNQHINSVALLFVPHPVCVTGDITHALKAEGVDASEDGTGRGNPIVAFDARQTDVLVSGDITAPLDTKQPGPAICFSVKDYGADATLNLSPTLRAGGHTGSHANAGVMPAVAYTVALRGREGGGTAELGGDVATALRASTGGGDKPHVLTSAVRRLTPRECERLQGFPDDYTLIPYRNKLSADGPRYKALGNSWAVPKFVWLGRRIAALMPVAAANDNTSNTESQVA